MLLRSVILLCLLIESAGFVNGAGWYGIWKYDEDKNITLQNMYAYNDIDFDIHNISTIKNEGCWLIGFAEDSLQLKKMNVVRDSLKNGLFTFEFPGINQLSWSLFQRFPNGRWLEYIKKKDTAFTQFEIQKENTFEGKIFQYNRNKLMISFYSYKRSMLNGAFATYFDNGSLLSLGSFKDDQFDELCIFTKDQKLSRAYSFLNKFEKIWSKNGNLMQFVQINTSRERDGIVKEWYENGKLKYEGRYRNGKQDGKWIFYKKDGSVSKVENFPSP
ncbi:toxin-antitoxin system YwqK family antitoxin [Ferruginibacter sp.]